MCRIVEYAKLKGPTRITKSNPWLHTGPPKIQTLGSLFHARCPLLKNLSLTPNLTLPCDRNRQSRCRGLVFVLHQGSSCPPELWGLRSAECPATP